MGKTVYSLVLSDNVVAAADKLAYKLGTSRSALIDRILAEHLGISTPETQMRSIMENIGRFFDDEIFRLQSAAKDFGMLIQSPLPYKYKPTIRYSVELAHKKDILGNLKVGFRTQNAALTCAMKSFLLSFTLIEARCLSGIHDISAAYDENRYVRTLYPPYKKDKSEFTADDIAYAIADYIRFFDRQIKIYFSMLDAPDDAAALTEKEYRRRVNSNAILI